MHIPDVFLSPAIAISMFALAFAFLAWSWKNVQVAYAKSHMAVLAMSSAFVFGAQFMNCPIASGTSGHAEHDDCLVDAGFAFGGLFAFGANVFNMAVIVALSFFVVRLLN